MGFWQGLALGFCASFLLFDLALMGGIHVQRVFYGVRYSLWALAHR